LWVPLMVVEGLGLRAAVRNFRSGMDRTRHRRHHLAAAAQVGQREEVVAVWSARAHEGRLRAVVEAAAQMVWRRAEEAEEEGRRRGQAELVRVLVEVEPWQRACATRGVAWAASCQSAEAALAWSLCSRLSTRVGCP
jgi:hypothetical protein